MDRRIALQCLIALVVLLSVVPATASCHLPIGQCAPNHVWDLINCGCKFVAGSSILIDTRRTGFKLSSSKAGSCVKFDLRGDGQKQCWSWPEAGSGNGWLAMPGRTNHDGMVDSGKDLFGSFTYQMHPDYVNAPCKDNPGCRDENGYYALLDELKQPDLGGYEDYGNPDTVYILSEKDKLWKDLRVWIDENRDGVSQPSELHKLSEFGIKSISLIPAMTGKYDEWGNWYRYAAPVNIEVEDVRSWSLKNDARIQGNTPHELHVQTYDIFLVNSEGPPAK